jgi:hypothetical protein
VSHTTEQRTRPDAITPQEEVVLSILENIGEENYAGAIAEALTYAQEMLPPHERIPTPVSGRTAGQYLGLLRTRGLVWCDPPPLSETGNQWPAGARKPRQWFLVQP